MLSADEEVTELLNRIVRAVGARVFGVEIGVDESGDKLIFVDANGDPVTNDGEEIIAATKDEIDRKDIGEVPARALRAAGILKYQEIARTRSP